MRLKVIQSKVDWDSKQIYFESPYIYLSLKLTHLNIKFTHLNHNLTYKFRSKNEEIIIYFDMLLYIFDVFLLI